MKKGFTLIEVLVVVLIVGVLMSIALPKYMRSLERARATEAMANIKALNEAAYAYAAARSGGECAPSFRKLAVSVAGTSNAADTARTTKNFTFTLNAATGAKIPGTDCAGVIATRNGGDKYNYVMWDPYIKVTSGQRSLACTSTVQASIDVCESLGMYTEGASPYGD